MRRFSATLAVGLFLVATTSAIGAPAGASGDDHPATHEDFASAVFSHGPRIDNRWLPYPVGTQYVLEGTVRRSGPVCAA